MSCFSVEKNTKHVFAFFPSPKRCHTGFLALSRKSFLLYFNSLCLSSHWFSRNGALTRQQAEAIKKPKSFFYARRFPRLLHSAKAWFTYSFRVWSDCSILKTEVIDIYDGNSLVHCFSLASCSIIFCSPSSALGIKGVCWLCGEHRLIGLFGLKIVSLFCGTSIHITSPCIFCQLFCVSEGNGISSKTSLEEYGTLVFSAWREHIKYAGGIVPMKPYFGWVPLATFHIAGPSCSAFDFERFILQI